MALFAAVFLPDAFFPDRFAEGFFAEGFRDVDFFAPARFPGVTPNSRSSARTRFRSSESSSRVAPPARRSWRCTSRRTSPVNRSAFLRDQPKSSRARSSTRSTRSSPTASRPASTYRFTRSRMATA